MTKRKKIVFLISNSIGELDVILPIICRLEASNERYYFVICFFVKSLFEKYSKEKHFKDVFGLLNIYPCFIQMPNKFDFRKKSSGNIKNAVLRVKRNIANPLSLIKVFSILRNADAVCHEFSCQIKSLKFVYLYSKILSKKIFTYNHGHSCTLSSNIKKIPYCTDYAHFLNFHKHNKSSFLNAGYLNQTTIGYPKFYPEWREFVCKNFGNNSFDRKYVLIFSRPLNPYYMSLDLYKELLIDTFLAVRECFGSDAFIVIKVHPREGTELIHELVANLGVEYVISHKESSVLSLHAHLAISFWTSAILSSAAFGVPSIEFYRESSAFLKVEPLGSTYRKIGFNSVDNKKDLIASIRRILSGKSLLSVKVLSTLNESSDFDFSKLLN